LHKISIGIHLRDKILLFCALGKTIAGKNSLPYITLFEVRRKPEITYFRFSLIIDVDI
jgi:hypothetical protein